MDVDSSTCSERFLRGIKWLEDRIRFDENRIKAELEKRRSRTTNAPDDRFKLGEFELERKLKLKYVDYEIEAAYVLSKIDSEVFREFMLIAESDPFWTDPRSEIMVDPQALWFLKELGLGEHRRLLEVADDLVGLQFMEGRIICERHEHSGAMRALVSIRPESQVLRSALTYWLENWSSESDVASIGIGVLALTELDFETYREIIREQIDYLKKAQHNDGHWGKHDPFDDTAYAMWAIARVDGIKDPSVQKGLQWLADKQKKNGSWEDSELLTALALLGLLAAGEGPRVSVESVQNESMKREQSIKRMKPMFVHTSPLYHGSLHVKEIHDRVFQMIHNAKNEIRISSPFIDMLYEEIINLRQQKPELTIKIITRPRKEAEGIRERIAKNVVDLLNIATKGNVVESPLIHSRMIIVDDEEVLVSSADLTRDQLYDEFNTGIWTSDKETVKKATEFFENFFSLEKQRIEQSKEQAG